MSNLTSDVNNYPGVGLYVKPGAKKFSCFCVGEKTPKIFIYIREHVATQSIFTTYVGKDFTSARLYINYPSAA